jgi:cardiolipin synthase
LNGKSGKNLCAAAQFVLHKNPKLDKKAKNLLKKYKNGGIMVYDIKILRENMRNFKDYKDKIITIPNILSLFRLCLIPLIIWLYCVEGKYGWTFLVVVISGLTDVIDGFIARRFNMISDFGKVFDPVADKLTQIAIIVCLLTRFWYMAIPLAIFLVKEVGMGVVALVAAKKTHTIKGADWHGKVNTVLFFVVMSVHLAWYNIPPALSFVLICLSTAMMLFSAVMYTIRNSRMLKENSRKKRETENQETQQ